MPKNTIELYSGELENLRDQVAYHAGLISDDEVRDAVDRGLIDEGSDLYALASDRVRHELIGHMNDEFFPFVEYVLGNATERVRRLLYLKLRRPGITQEEMATVVGLTGRARVNDSFRALRKRFPQIMEALCQVDARGGDRRADLSPLQKLSDDYRRMQQKEALKPEGERRKCKGAGGILEELAKKHGLMGRTGRPSWRAAELRLSGAEVGAKAAAGGGVDDKELLRSYRQLQASEKGKPFEERRRCHGEGGLLAELAERHGILGRCGEPSWQAVSQRLKRYRHQAKSNRREAKSNRREAKSNRREAKPASHGEVVTPDQYRVGKEPTRLRIAFEDGFFIGD